MVIVPLPFAGIVPRFQALSPVALREELAFTKSNAGGYCIASDKPEIAWSVLLLYVTVIGKFCPLNTLLGANIFTPTADPPAGTSSVPSFSNCALESAEAYVNLAVKCVNVFAEFVMMT